MTKTLLSALFLLAAFLPVSFANHLQEHLLVSAKIEGAQEVPAVATPAKGVASLVINRTRDSISLNITVSKLSGPIIGVHIHEGRPGMNGPVVIDLMPYLEGNRVAGVLIDDVNDAFIAKLLNGDYYVNFHTPMHPGGEIRGQLTLETDYSFVSQLSGAQEVPPVTTAGIGVGVFNLSRAGHVIQFTLSVNNLTGPITGAHLHFGKPGMNGPVAVDLMPFMDANNEGGFSGVIMNPSQAVIDSMFAGAVYANVHTTMHPGGEVRGQLVMPGRKLMFDARIEAEQEVPPTTSDALASATVWLSATFDTLWYDIVTTDLTTPMTGAHFHNAPPGMNGPVVLNLASSISGNRIFGMNTTITPEFVGQLLRGELYINLHSEMFPGGEIRGQVYRAAREGYTFTMAGNQEVPPVATPAVGSGIVSIDRDQSNAHFMLVWDDLSGPLTGAHFHKAPPGVNGPVIFNLMPFVVDSIAAFGYWTAASAMPFTTANSVQFRNDSIYANVHSSEFPSGEIRGQVERGFVVFDATVAAPEAPAFIRQWELFPNPIAGSELTVRLRTDRAENVRFVITDALGKTQRIVHQTLVAGEQTIRLDISALPTALYYLGIQTDAGQVATRKFIRN